MKNASGTNVQTALMGLVVLTIAIGACIFIAAWTIHYWQGWVYLGLFFVSSFLITLYLINNDPALLKRRLHAGPSNEKEQTQKRIQSLSSLGFIASLVVPALDHHFHWSHLPRNAVGAGDLLTAAGFYLVFLVFQVNTFASAIIETFGEQKVISTGPYRFVRHPMYLGGLLLFIGTPMALGSSWGLLTLFVSLPAVIWRLLEEEKTLTKNLPGYTAYCTKVRWRLIPGLF